MVMTNQIKFKIHSRRTLASPYKRTEKDESAEETIYYLLVNMKDLPGRYTAGCKPTSAENGNKCCKKTGK